VPTSGAQDALWLAELLQPGAPGHRAVLSYRVAGPLRPQALHAAWRAVLLRHDVLRTRIADLAGRPAQTVSHAADDAFSYADRSVRLGQVPAMARDRLAEEACAAAAAVHLADGPVARLAVVRQAPDLHRVMLAVHLAVADDHSLGLMTRELSERYSSEARHSPVRSALYSRPAQYADYARLERRELRAAPARELAHWWNERLQPPPASASLPWQPGGTGAEPEGGVMPLDFDPAMSRSLARYCRTKGVSPAAVLLAALAAVLTRYGGTSLVPVCVPVSLRPTEFADTVGQFDNLVVVRADLSGDPGFHDLVLRISREMADTFEHRALPFATVVAGLGIDRGPAGIPLGDVVFDCREELPAVLTLEGMAVTGGRTSAPPAASDLAVIIRQTRPAIGGVIGYRGGEPGRSWIPLTLSQMRTLLSAGLHTPDAPVAKLPLDNAAAGPAGGQLTSRVSAGPPISEPVHELVRRNAATAQAPAVQVGDRTVSRAALLRAAAPIATRLRAAGAAGSAVAIQLPHGATHLATTLGVLQAGGQFIWLGEDAPPERVRSILAARRPAGLVVGDDAAGARAAQWYLDHIGGYVMRVAEPDGFGAPSANDSAVPEWPESGGSVGPDDVAYIAYTSGSSGTPKAITQTHGAFGQFITWMGAAFSLGPGSRVAQWVAADHDPSLCEAFATLAAGGTLCPVLAHDRAHPDRFLRWLIDERVTFLQTVPSFASELVRAVREAGLTGRATALDRLVLMGEAVPWSLVRQLRTALPGTRLFNIYGPTETIAATWCEITDDVAGDTPGPIPIGEAIPGRDVLILDEQRGLCPTGVTGEMVIRSPHVARGYRTRLDSADVYLTGDLGRRRPDGLLEFRGRLDWQVKVAGNRLELSAIEDALADVDGVAECAVVPCANQDGLVTSLVAYIVRDAGPSNSGAGGDAALRARLRERFGPLPVSFRTLPAALPRNRAGKVDRRRLPAPSAPSAGTREEPGTPTQQAVAALCCELLRVDGVGVHQSLFAAGADSLLIPRLAHQIRQRFGTEISVRECFASPTVAAISARIEQLL
jgi:(S)-beta-tyrosine adenylation enzyme